MLRNRKSGKRVFINLSQIRTWDAARGVDPYACYNPELLTMPATGCAGRPCCTVAIVETCS